MILLSKILVFVFWVVRAFCTDQQLSCRDTAECKDGQCRITSLHDVAKIKESLAANESPVKCNDPIGDKSFLQLYLQNRKELEALEAEFERAVKSTNKLESMLKDINQTNELSFVGREQVIAELDRRTGYLQDLQTNTSKELSDLNETVNAREDELRITITTAMEGLRTDVKKLILSKLPCDFKVGEVCYWTKLGGRYSFPQARKVCESNRSSVAIVTNKSVYDAIVEYTKKKISKSVRIWTGLTVEPGTWVVKPVNSFTKWKHSDEPLQGAKFISYTNVYLHIFRVENTIQKTGMMNVRPTWNMQGVVCQFSI